MMLRIAGIVGSPNVPSRSRLLLQHAVDEARARGAQVDLVDLTGLPAGALLGRAEHDEVDAAVRTVREAAIVLAATPTYRASYSGLLKCFFDLLPPDALKGKVGVPIVTGTSLDDLRVAGQALRALFTSLGATVVGPGAYALDGDFTDERPSAPVLRRVDRAVSEALAASGATTSS